MTVEIDFGKDRAPEFTEMVMQFARQVNDMPYHATSVTIFRELPEKAQMECYIAGTLLGLFMACTPNDGTVERRAQWLDKIEEYVATCVPVAKRIVQKMIEMGDLDHGRSYNR